MQYIWHQVSPENPDLNKAGFQARACEELGSWVPVLSDEMPSTHLSPGQTSLFLLVQPIVASRMGEIPDTEGRGSLERICVNDL